MKWLVLALALTVVPALAKDRDKKAPPEAHRKTPAAKAHSKPTPEQIRKFDQLEKKPGK